MTSLSLAQQYEQDKQKLVKTCFSKYEPDGSLHESYITHVRIVEDSHYPSSRPPPTSSASHKKTRILTLAVKKSGTVRLHKGRENPNGSFQIGRTWTLDELTEIQIDVVTENGLLVTIGKPYYWETNTAKERTVFVKSLCNIYHKFTRGGLPVLTNFDKKTYGDIIKLGNHGKPATLKYVDGKSSGSSGPIPIQSTANSHSASSSGPGRSSLSNSTYSNPKNNSMISTTSTTLSPVTPVSNTHGLPSPISVRDNSYLALSGNKASSNVYGQRNQSASDLRNDTHSLTSQKSMGSLPKSKQYDTPSFSLPSSKSQTNLSRPTLQRIRTQENNNLNVRPDAKGSFRSPTIKTPKELSSSPSSSPYSQRASPVIPSVDRSREKLDSRNKEKPDSRSNLKNELLGDNDHNKSNRSSILSVEFKSTSPRASITPEDVDDSAAVMNEIYKQRTLNKKPSMKLRKSSSNIFSEAAREIPPPTPSQSPMVTKVQNSFGPPANANVFDSGVDIADDKYDGESIDGINEDAANDDLKNKRQSIRQDTDPIEELFEEIEWNSKDGSKKISQKLMRTLLKTEYESINSLINISSNFLEIDTYIEESIQQCEKLDPMLTFFQVELDGFSEEISYIEKQGNGLQVTTANKKVLWNELKDIISNVSLSTEELKVLVTYKISRNENNIKIIENVLGALYSALQTIRGATSTNSIKSDLGNMNALTERNKTYENYSSKFLLDVQNSLTTEFKLLYTDIDNLVRSSVNKGGYLDVDSLIKSLNNKFSQLLIYGAFVLYAKEISKSRFYSIMEIYQKCLKRAIHSMIENVLKFNNHVLSKVLGSHFQYRFSFDYRENRSNVVISSKSKITSKNVTRLFDLNLCEIIYEKINGIISVLQKVILQQQNFISEFFQLTLSEIHLDEYLKLYESPKDRVNAFLKKKEFTGFLSKQEDDNDGDEESAHNKAAALIENIFNDELSNTIKFLTDFSTKHVQILPLIVLIIDNNIETLAKQNNDFIVSAFLKKISNRFKNIWYNYNQIQGKIFFNNLNSNLIMDKKMSLLFVIKSYVQIVTFIEKSLTLTGLKLSEIENNSIRLILDTTYDDYNKFILKAFNNSFGSVLSSSNKNRRNTRSSVGPKMKKGQEEAHLNRCVNVVINSNYLINSFEPFDLITINELRNKLINDYLKDAKVYYINCLLQMTLSKLIDFIDGIEALLKNTSKSISADPTKNNTYSKDNFRQLMSFYSKSVVHQGVMSNFKRVESDFCYEGNDEESVLLGIDEKPIETIQNKLISSVWSQVETEYILIFKRLEGIWSKHYRDVELEVNRNVLVGMFKNVQSNYS